MWSCDQQLSDLYLACVIESGEACTKVISYVVWHNLRELGSHAQVLLINEEMESYEMVC